jgi:hypothetical protein
MLFKQPTPTTSNNENSENTVKINDGSGVSEVVTESNSSGCVPIRENVIEKVTEKVAETKDGNSQPSDFNKESLTAHEATGSSAEPKKRFSFKLGTIHRLRKHLYSTCLTSKFFTKSGFFASKQ